MERDRWVILKGKTRHGKNRIHQHGDTWSVLQCTNGRMLLQSLNKTDKGVHDMRWVELREDQNFSWEETSFFNKNQKSL